MRKSSYMLAVALFVAMALLVSVSGCGKKQPAAKAPVATETEPSAQTAPSSPAPTISLTASPTAIEKGQSTKLAWNSSNATSVIIDNGIGTVEASGRRTISPAVSTTYLAKATGPGGNAAAEARVTVTPPAAVTPPLQPAISDSAFFEAKIQDAFFDYDQYSLREDAKKALQSNALALAERPGIRITIEGHCDERGSEKYNLSLGDMRANAAKEFLLSLGVSAGRIDTISYGEERPFCEDHNEECWQNNRRAHIVMR